MLKTILNINFRRLCRILTVCAALASSASLSYSADVIILGNEKLKPVTDVVEAINETINYKTVILTPEDVKDNLDDVFYKEDAKVVVALGKGALKVARSLPDTIPVVYGLIINRQKMERRNITGVYMATPVREYISYLNRYFPDIKKVGIICEPGTWDLQDAPVKTPKVELYSATNSYEFIEGINLLGEKVDALLLLPERNLMSRKAIEKVYIYSFKERTPVIGISEKYVKTGSLFSLGFDLTDMGKQIGEMIHNVVLWGNAYGIPQSPPSKYNLYINKKTGDTMRVAIPPELLTKAKKVYQ